MISSADRRNQMAQLFDRDVKTIGKHINNALNEELDVQQVLSVVESYSDALDMLDDYDHQTMVKPKGNKTVYYINNKCSTKNPLFH